MKNELKVKVNIKDRSAWVDSPDGRRYFRTSEKIWMVLETKSNRLVLLDDVNLAENLNNLTANIIGETRFVIKNNFSI